MKKFGEPGRSRARQRQMEVKRKHPTCLDGARGSKERQVSISQSPQNNYQICLTSQKMSF